jgi:hypothetical protein
MILRKFPAGWVVAVALLLMTMASMNAASPEPACKPVTHYGVSGCEILPDHTCPAGHHKQAVGPPNPQMMGPTFLMCVPDKPAKEEPPKSAPSDEQKSLTLKIDLAQMSKSLNDP